MAASLYHRLLRTSATPKSAASEGAWNRRRGDLNIAAAAGQAGFRSRLAGLSKMISAVFHAYAS